MLHHLWHALRRLWNAPGLALLAVLALTFGIGAASTKWIMFAHVSVFVFAAAFVACTFPVQIPLNPCRPCTACKSRMSQKGQE